MDLPKKGPEQLGSTAQTLPREERTVEMAKEKEEKEVPLAEGVVRPGALRHPGMQAGFSPRDDISR